MVRIVPATGPETRLGTNALINGPACVPLKNRGYGVAGVVTIGPEKPSVTLEISLKGPNGNTLKQCQWTFAKQGTFHVMVALIP